MARSATFNLRGGDSGLQITTIDWVADEADGSFASLAIPQCVRGQVVAMDTVPGTPTPTDQYDVTVLDPRGLDLLGGAGANRGIVGAERAVPASNVPAPFEGGLNIVIANNAVVSAAGTIILYWLRF